MKGKILCPAGCQNPVSRITQAKEILKNPSPAGSWRPLKCIFSGKEKAAHSGSEALSCPFYVRKNQTGAVCGSYRASIDQCTKFRFSLICPPGQILVGVATPNPPFAAPAAEKSPTNIFSDFSKTVPIYTLFFSYQ